MPRVMPHNMMRRTSIRVGIESLTRFDSMKRAEQA